MVFWRFPRVYPSCFAIQGFQFQLFSDLEDFICRKKVPEDFFYELGKTLAAYRTAILIVSLILSLPSVKRKNKGNSVLSQLLICWLLSAAANSSIQYDSK